MLLQLTHEIEGYNAYNGRETGLAVICRLYDVDSLFTELYIPAKILTLNIKNNGEVSNLSIVLPVNLTESEEITDRVGGRLEVKIYTVINGSELFVAGVYDATIDDFRYDIGENSASYTLVLRDNFTTPIKSSITITDFVNKQKLSYSGASTVYIYSVIPLDYRLYSIGAQFTEGTVTGVISNISLSVYSTKIELLIEVTT